MTVTIHTGDCRAVMRAMPAKSAHACITSPPYFGLRDYNVAGQIGLEPRPDCLGWATGEPCGACFVCVQVEVFREVRRVLRDDGTCWVNLGDSYAASHGPRTEPTNTRNKTGHVSGGKTVSAGMKPKDLMGIPWRVALALQADGWYLRQDIIWSKKNPMPESVRDRCTKAHEYLFLLSKGPKYYFDQEAILEPVSLGTHARLSQNVQAQVGSERAHAGGKTNGNMKAVGRTNGVGWGYADGDNAKQRTRKTDPGAGNKNNASFDAAMAIMSAARNKRSVWEVSTQPFSEAHFATYPPALIEPCVLASVPVGGVVLDPFGGAGTTGLVAESLGRDSVLIELNPDYAAIAHRRTQQCGLALGATA